LSAVYDGNNALSEHAAFRFPNAAPPTWCKAKFAANR